HKKHRVVPFVPLVVTSPFPLNSFMLGDSFKKLFGSSNDREVKKILPLVQKINDLDSQTTSLTDEQLQAKTAEFKQRSENGETLEDLLPDVFAVVRETGKRALNMRHFDVQLIGGVVLHQGRISEMKTGEGKTLVATLPGYLNALEGKGVHIVTVNDYLARRDSEWMGRLYKFLGLSVGVIQHGLDDNERRESYGSDITYGTNNEFGFDYLRDNMKFDVAHCTQRPHHYAIVDEVDSILIDEARTPLIISGPSEESTDKYFRIDKIVPKLRRDIDYQVDEKHRTVTLTEEGFSRCEDLLSVDDLSDMANMEILHHINQALRAHTLYKRDVEYVVKEGEVIIVDEFTGRLMPGRRCHPDESGHAAHRVSGHHLQNRARKVRCRRKRDQTVSRKRSACPRRHDFDRPFGETGFDAQAHGRQARGLECKVPRKGSRN